MPTGKRPRFAILGSGRGSNADALMAAFQSGFLPAELVLVISDRPSAPILDKARDRSYPTALHPSRGRPREEQEAELTANLAAHGYPHLLLAGYMRLLSPRFVEAYPGVILNIHPSLLPDFPGLHAVTAQWQAGVRVAGATVHFVDAGCDTGPILLCGSLEVRGDEGIEGLGQRILTEVEHVLYPRAVRLLIERLERGMPLHGQKAQQLPKKEIPQHEA
jgi:phosphoribosylglycinamide formyltransferase-1